MCFFFVGLCTSLCSNSSLREVNQVAQPQAGVGYRNRGSEFD